jgi:hypothetical protein
MAGDALQQNIGPLERSKELDYAAVGYSIANLAYKHPSIRARYNLLIQIPERSGRSVRWVRGDEDFELSEIRANAAYALSRIWLPRTDGQAAEPEQPGAVVDMYLFGDESVAKEGLLRIIHARSKNDYTAQDFIRHARERGTITRDSSRPRKITPRIQEKQAFRRAIFSILERPQSV